MGWGGMGTPLPHPNFISKFIIIFPVIKGEKTLTIAGEKVGNFQIEHKEKQLCTI